MWRTDGAAPRQRSSNVVINEIVKLRRLGFRFIALADDIFIPVTLTDIRLAEQQHNTARLNELKSIRAERFSLMRRLAQLPPDTIFFTQITMEAAEDPEFLHAMQAAHIKGGARRGRVCDPGGLEGRLQRIQLRGPEFSGSVENLSKAWYLRARLFHFWPTQRSSLNTSTFDATAEAALRQKLRLRNSSC